MLPPFLLAISMITVSVFIFVKPVTLKFSGIERHLPKTRVIIYLLLFLYAIICVFKILPYYTSLFIVIPAILIMDRRAILDVDYGLLLTFVFFFIFAGNMSRIGVVQSLLSSLLAKSTMLFSALSCQVISNVPSAILLSQFTENYKELLIGVNIGGCGTLISSLASLITFREFVAHNPKKTKRYIAVFSAFNFTFLIVLLVFCSIII
jgi:hypothetical protein